MAPSGPLTYHVDDVVPHLLVEQTVPNEEFRPRTNYGQR